jgi:hypothetical protein
VKRSDSFYEPHFHFILTAGYFKGVYAIRQVVEAIPIQLLLVFFNLGLESAANDSGIIPQDGAQHTFLGFAYLERQVVDKDGGFDF